MALAETTLSGACAEIATEVSLASLTSVSAGRLLQVDGELMQVTKAYASANPVPVIRGIGGTQQVAHVTSARVVHGDAADFGATGAGVFTNYPPAGRARKVESITATTATLTLAPAGVDHVVVLNGTAAITLTIPVPTKDKDGDRLTVVSNGAAAHIPTFSGGLGGAGTSYDAITFNASGTLALEVIACNEVWCMAAAPALTGTVTNITAGIA